MKKKKINILCTIGPSSLNKTFLNYAKKNVNLLRLNMSHIEVKDLTKYIKIIRKYTSTPICIDTEGAQIRTKIKNIKFYKKNQIIFFNKKKNKNIFYPEYVNSRLKPGDILDVGFQGLKIVIKKNTKTKIVFKVLDEGTFENNKGVYIRNRKFKLNYLTNKDLKAIKIAKKLNINNFALSFTNSVSDMKNFSKILPFEKKIFKIETKQALKDIKKILAHGENFLIDRGDLSKEISIEMIPVAQRKILSTAYRLKNKNIFVATNFLESMLTNAEPTRGEVNDIYSTLSLGASGLVLAAETAIGKYPIECVNYLKKIYKIFYKHYKTFKY